ncbi:R-spondin-1 precursor [Oryzias latipes]|uniref:R-spondin-1 n=1 Tax=Oryzias latipes TaxID=8090 RepID=G0ZE06_ORYLA|nr:R-spondin-1 precursor [Oryzias latipes]AEL21375.1 R-spondin-1 precursor [Oryzias latipes]
MQLGLVALAMIILSSMGHSDVVKLWEARRQKRVSTEGPPSCPKGCDRCSEYNGCVKCKPKLFIFLERNDIRQVGVCLASCPVGYFGMRNPEGNNRCTQCKIDNCEACFNRNFCTKCKEGLYSHSGRCYVSCPPGQRTANETMECVGQHALECELGEWSQWSSCMKKNKTCGFKKGSQFRVRVPLQQTYAADSSSTLEETCTSQSERRKCVVPKTPCVKDRKNKGDNTNRRENRRGLGREGKDGSRGGGGKRRRGPSRTTTVPSITTSSVT